MTKCTVAPTPAATPCFSGAETVELASGQVRLISDLKIGDKVLAADTQGHTVHSEVVYLPHKTNKISTTFQSLQLENGRTIKLTPDHLLLAGPCPQTQSQTKQCAVVFHTHTNSNATLCLSSLNTTDDHSQSQPQQLLSLRRADSVSPGMCVSTIDGPNTVLHTNIVQGYGLYTLVTNAPYVIVNGIIASPFSFNHVILHAYYNIHRTLYAILPRQIYNGVMLTQVNEMFGFMMMTLFDTTLTQSQAWWFGTDQKQFESNQQTRTQIL